MDDPRDYGYNTHNHAHHIVRDYEYASQTPFHLLDNKRNHHHDNEEQTQTQNLVYHFRLNEITWTTVDIHKSWYIFTAAPKP